VQLVVFFHLLFEVVREDVMLLVLDNHFPIFATHEVAVAQGVSSIGEVRAGVEGQIVCPDDDLVILSQHKVFHSVDFETDVNLALGEEDYLINLVQLFDDDGLRQLLSRLQMRQNIKHKIFITMVFECVKSRLVLTIHILKSESLFLEGLYKFPKEKFYKNGALHVDGQLIVEALVLFLLDSYDPVMLPLVVEEDGDVFLQILVK
jgi:hypothetical protein